VCVVSITWTYICQYCFDCFFIERYYVENTGQASEGKSRMNVSTNQLRSVIAKLYSLSIYGDQTKTASEVSQTKSQLITILKKASDLSREDINHLQTIINTYESSFFNILFLVMSGVDFDDLKPRQFNLMLLEDNPKQYLKRMNDFHILDRLFEGTGISEETERMKEVTKLYKTARRSFSLRSLVKGLDRSKLTVGGMPVQEFLADTILDVVTGDVHAMEGDDYLKSLGLTYIRRLKGKKSLLARYLTTARKSYEKRASLTEEEHGTRSGDWTRLASAIVGKFRYAKNTIRDFTINRMRQEENISVPGNMLAEESWDSIYDSLTELNFDGGYAEEFLDEYQNRGLQSKKLRDAAEALLAKQKAGALDPQTDVAMIMGVAFTKEIDGPQGAELLRFALDNIEHVSSQASVQSEMRSIAYKRLFQLGRLTKRELGFLDTASLSGEVESHSLRVQLKKKLNIQSLDGLFTAFKDKGNKIVLDQDTGEYTLVNSSGSEFFDFEEYQEDMIKAQRLLDSMSAHISDKAGIGVYETVKEYVRFWEVVERHTELALKRMIAELTKGGRKKNEEAIAELESIDLSKVVVGGVNLEIGIAIKDHLNLSLGRVTISDHPLSSLSSTDYMASATEGQGGASQFAGKVTNTDMSRFSQLRRALLQDDQYKDKMKELDDYRIYIQKASQTLSGAITFPYKKKGSNFIVDKFTNNLDNVRHFLRSIEMTLDIGSMPEPPSFLSPTDMDKFELGFLEAVGEATKLHEATDYDNLPSDFEDKVNQVFTDILTQYNEYSADFPQNYRNAVGAIVESDEDGQFASAFESLKAKIVRDAMINELKPSSRRGSDKFPSQKRALRARRLGKKMGMNTTNIIESVMGVNKQGPVLSEAQISTAINNAQSAWRKASDGHVESGVQIEIERLLREGDFLVPEARLSKSIKSLDKKIQKKVMKAFTTLRDAIAADVLTDYAERARVRSRIETDKQIDEASKELQKLEARLKKKKKKTEDDRKTLAEIGAGTHELQKKMGRLSNNRTRSSSVAASSAREQRNENSKSPYSVRVDEIVRETDLDVTIKRTKTQKAEERLRRSVRKMNENMASLPSIDGKNSNKNTRVLSDITMASLLASSDVRNKVSRALVSADLDAVMDFAFGEALSDCFPTLREHPLYVQTRFRGFMSAFGQTRKFFDRRSGTVFSPSIDNIFGDASAASISDYVDGFMLTNRIALSKEAMEYVYENAFDDQPDEDGEYLPDEEHFQIYEALGIGEEVISRMQEVKNPLDEEGEPTGVSPAVKDALKDIRDQLRTKVLNIGDFFVPSESFETAVKIDAPANSGFLRVEDLNLPKQGKADKPKEDLIQCTKSFIHGCMLLGGLFVNKADDDLALSLGIEPQCLEDFAKLVGLDQDS